MFKELPNVQGFPPLWQMGALLELCPAHTQDMVYQKFDEILEDFERMKQLTITTMMNMMERRMFGSLINTWTREFQRLKQIHVILQAF